MNSAENAYVIEVSKVPEFVEFFADSLDEHLLTSNKNLHNKKLHLLPI
jgi:hypothetical protein